MSKIIGLTENFTFMMRVRLRLTGSVPIGLKTRPGWSGYLPHYVRRCPTHGLYETYPKGYDGILVCPQCVDELFADDPE
jgi:hypothetical protein